MKQLAQLLTAIIFAWAQLPAQESWVRQTDLTSGLTYDLPLGPTGGPFTAALPVSEQGSLFELFARGTAWDNNIYLLDTKLIRAYAPVIELVIATEDAYVRGDPASSNFVRRTRADRPFGINLQVSGLVPGSTNQAERELYFSIQGRLFDTETYSGAGAEAFLIHEANLQNGAQSLSPLYHELPSASLSGGCGEQIYTFIRYAADGVPDTILAQPKIEVWPVATASIENVTAGQVFLDRIPSIIVRLNHLYPDSRTYVQLYTGTQALGTAGTLINGTERRFGRHYNPELEEEPTNVPQTLSISMEDLSNYAATDGIYTLEVITETPFFNRAPERLLHVTFEVDRTVSSRGQITTAERSPE
ncbi:MAG TPA: hypothetical protein DIT13_00030 [Verrucomicrobiales bacterium]|nr:hypothetical protein [Verrucomicrobiales bacterium]HRJ09150.1 hypothetical protein [Prosthecobacter sp.]HRK15636.1 hypothetical protein [Prosthecobacter sp.]